MYNMKGKLVEVLDVEKVTDSFSKKVFVINNCALINPQNFRIETSNNHMKLVDGFQKGDMINVFFNMNSKDWVDRSGKVRSFITLHAWKIERADMENASIVGENNKTESENN
jgi:hypothetical protein